MVLVALALILVAIAASWLILVRFVSAVCPSPEDKHICLLIAHPDDEAMFISPTVINLANPARRNHVEILCLCSGRDPSLRETRRNELYRSAANLGLHSASDVTVLDDDQAFPDSMSIFWSAEKVADALSSRFNSGNELDVLITFDNHGISSHANHISLLHGATHWIRAMDPKARDTVTVYSLTTTNLFRKYISIFDAPLSLLLYLVKRNGSSQPSNGLPDRFLFFSAFQSYRRAQKSMTACHRSQMLWFRYGWIMLSRYVSTNDLKKVELD